MRVHHNDRVPAAIAVAVVALLFAGVMTAQASAPVAAHTVVVLERSRPGVSQDLPSEGGSTDLPQPPQPQPLVQVPTTVLPTVEPEPVAQATILPEQPVAEASSPSFPQPIRGVWVHVLDDTLLTRAGIARMLDAVDASGGNTVVVEVARRYDAYYNSAFLDRGNDPGFEAGLDVLAEVAAGARARGISVHAWFTAMPAWQPETANAPEPTNWTYREHGLPAPEEQRWLTRSSSGEWGEYLDPGHPDVQNLVVATAAELAAYDIDAVHVDYLRYPGNDWGYNPVALGRFQADTGRTDIPAPTDVQFSDWRRQQTTAIARRMREAIQQVNPTVGVSAALIAWGDGPVNGRSFESTPAYSQVMQPWPQWMADGLVDVAMPMLYFRETRHAAFYRNWMSYVAGVRAATGVTTAPGQGSWLNTVEDSVTQLTAAAPFVDGEVLFSYQQTADGQGPDALLNGLAASLWQN